MNDLFRAGGFGCYTVSMNRDTFVKSLGTTYAAGAEWEALSFVFFLLFGIVSAINGDRVAIFAFIGCAFSAASMWENRKFMLDLRIWEEEKEPVRPVPTGDAGGDIINTNERK